MSTAVLAAISLIFFLPANILSHIGLSTLRDDYRLYLGLAFILSASLVAVHAVFALAPLIASQWEKYRYRSKMFQSLRALSAQEKEFLRPYIDNDRATRNARIDDGVANGLHAKQILFRAANVGVAMQFPYNLQPLPQRLLKRHRWLPDHPSKPQNGSQFLRDWFGIRGRSS